MKIFNKNTENTCFFRYQSKIILLTLFFVCFIWGRKIIYKYLAKRKGRFVIKIIQIMKYSFSYSNFGSKDCGPDTPVLGRGQSRNFVAQRFVKFDRERFPSSDLFR